jgi:dienelactone hydrolase
MFRIRVRSAAIGVTLSVLAGACSGGSDPGMAGVPEDQGTASTMPSSPTVPETQPADYAGRGALAVGVVSLSIDQERPVEVFYPADPGSVPSDAVVFSYTAEDVWGDLAGLLESGDVDPVEVPGAWRDIPPAVGSFPVVVVSHGLGGNRFNFSLHAAHLASWGYVVAVPQHPVRDLSAFSSGVDPSPSDEATILRTIGALEDENGRAGSQLEGIVVDHAAAIGHSAGGRDAALAAYDDAVDTWIGLAPTPPIPDEVLTGRNIYDEAKGDFDAAAGEFDLEAFMESTEPPDVPSLMLVADGDFVYSVEERRRVFDWLPAPKTFVVLAATGHYVFADECLTFEQAGVVPYAATFGLQPESETLQLLEDGCLGPGDAPVEEVWGVWYHLTVAHLNSVFGIDGDAARAALDPEFVNQRFGERIAAYDRVVERSSSD